MMIIGLILIVMGIFVYIIAIVLLKRDCIKGYGATMGGIMMFTHLSLTGSVLIACGTGFTGFFHWIGIIITGTVFFLISIFIRILIDRKKSRTK